VPTAVAATTEPVRRAGGAHRRSTRPWRTRAGDALAAVPDAITPPVPPRAETS
jgi:hypothetical protein